MLGFVQSWIGPKANPIGIDFGSDCLRLAQVQQVDGDHHLLAAASADVPPHARNDDMARMNFFAENIRDLLAQGRFHGRHAVLALPAASMFIEHLRMPRMDEAAIKRALPWEAKGKLPIDPSAALLRHLVAGEVYADQEPQIEVILLAARKEMVNRYLAEATKARLDVQGIMVEPMALVDCFDHIYRRKVDREAVSCFVDIGAVGTRVVVARDGHIFFARVIGIGGDHFSQAAAAALAIDVDQAKALRIQLCQLQPNVKPVAKSEPAKSPSQVAVADAGQMQSAFPVLSASMAIAAKKEAACEDDRPVVSLVADEVMADEAEGVENEVEDQSPAISESSAMDLAEQGRIVDQACQAPLRKLVEEMELSRRYYETTFPNKPVDRLVFVGGEARQRGLCQQIAQGMGLAAQLGDPLCRMARHSEVAIESGIDRRQPQPAWAVAIGLSMGAKRRVVVDEEAK